MQTLVAIGDASIGHSAVSYDYLNPCIDRIVCCCCHSDKCRWRVGSRMYAPLRPSMVLGQEQLWPTWLSNRQKSNRCHARQKQ